LIRHILLKDSPHLGRRGVRGEGASKVFVLSTPTPTLTLPHPEGRGLLGF